VIRRALRSWAQREFRQLYEQVYEAGRLMGIAQERFRIYGDPETWDSAAEAACRAAGDQALAAARDIGRGTIDTETGWPTASS
jgi:hypothetical protein